MTLGDAIARFEAIYAELLREERAEALETSTAARESRAQRVGELRAQSGELERLIERLSAHPISPNADESKRN
jgi:type VI protein secretion system component VasK